MIPIIIEEVFAPALKLAAIKKGLPSDARNQTTRPTILLGDEDEDSMTISYHRSRKSRITLPTI
jgi:hypothetical protein